MTPSQQIFLISSIAIVVTVYGIYKVIQWRRSKKPIGPEPKRRPKGTSVIQPNRKTDEVVTGELDSASLKPSSAFSSILKEENVSDSAGNETEQPRQAAESSSSSEAAVAGVKLQSAEDPLEEYPYFDQSDYTFGPVTASIAAMMPTSPEGREAMTRSLRNAGFYSPHAWHNLTAIRYLCMVAPIFFFGALLIVVPPQLEAIAIISMVVTTILGWALPALYVRTKAGDRLREIGNAMPDMLDLLNMCVSQGMTVTSALRRVGRDIEPVYPALAKEMKIVTDQAHAGSLKQSLLNLGDRVDLPEIHSFTSLLVQTEQMGTSVSEALTEYSDNMRESMKQRADEKANSATFKLLFPTVLCLMPAVYLFLLGPAVVELNRFFEEGGSDVLRTEIPEEYTN